MLSKYDIQIYNQGTQEDNNTGDMGNLSRFSKNMIIMACYMYRYKLKFQPIEILNNEKCTHRKQRFI